MNLDIPNDFPDNIFPPIITSELEEVEIIIPENTPEPSPEPIDEEKIKYKNLICYFINLEKRPDRLKHVLKELKYFNTLFLYKRFEAIDANDLNMQHFINNKIITPNPRWRDHTFKRGHLACMLSHLTCWKQFLRTDHKFLLVLEDDIKINKPYFNEMFPKIMNSINYLNFDWLYLGRQSLGSMKFYHGEQIGNIFYKPEIYGNGNHSYILSRAGANKMVRYLTTDKIDANNQQFQIFSWPIDMLDEHKKFFIQYMGCDLRILSVIPQNYNTKKEYSRSKSINSDSKDFLFYSHNWCDSDTRVV